MLTKYKLIENNSYRTLLQQNESLRKETEIAAQVIRNMGSGNKEGDALSSVLEKSDSLLIKELHQLQNKLKKIGEEEKQRNWSAEGQAIFAHILRNHDADLEKLGNHLLSKLVNYVEANQASLFVLSEIEGTQMLEQIGCYAYGRKKFTNKTVVIGEGLVGQTFLEKETTLLKEVPADYVQITSGLGEATPRCVVLVPLKINDDVLGILELASFKVFLPYVVEFLEKISESIASAISNVRIAKRTQELLRETQTKTEQMRAQEEELRQNLEELEATQEEMIRKQQQLDQKSQMIKLILDNLPMPTFVKDENGCYTLVNKAETELLGVDEATILGKDDSYFVNDASENDEIRKSDIEALQSVRPIELPMQSYTTKSGKRFIFKTIKVSFLNSFTGQRNIIGISVDLTDRVRLEQKLIAEKVVQQNNVMIDLAGRQRMLSQKIGFYAEMVCRGKKEPISQLQKAIDLHHHSLDVIKNGGWPLEIDALVPLGRAHEELKPFIEKVEDAWYPYKDAAEMIIKLIMEPEQNSKVIESTISTIEEKGEELLLLNNKLLSQYKKINQKELMGAEA